MLETLTLLFVIGMLAIVSPGPDFFLILKNASTYPRRAALATVGGITLGIVVHITYCILGLGWIISRSVLAYSLIKYAGALYLLYLGYRGLVARDRSILSPKEVYRASVTMRRAFMEGFLCNLLNPKVTLFMLSVFTQVIDPGTPQSQQVIYGGVFVFQTIFYWSALVLVVQQRHVQEFISRIQGVVNKVFGTILIALGLKVAFSD